MSRWMWSSAVFFQVVAKLLVSNTNVDGYTFSSETSVACQNEGNQYCDVACSSAETNNTRRACAGSMIARREGGVVMCDTDTTYMPV